MSQPDDKAEFWTSPQCDLRNEGAAAAWGGLDPGRIDAKEIEQAQRLLAEIRPEEARPLPVAEVDRLVAAALNSTSEPCAEAVAAGGVARRRGRVARLVAALLALGLTPVLLVGAVATVAVARVVLHNTEKTLTFSDAVRHLVSDATSETNKNPALGNVCLRLRTAIARVEAVAAEAETAGQVELAAASRAALQRVQAELTATGSFVLRAVSGDPRDLSAAVQDPERPQADRLAALRSLTDLMVYGIAALNEAGRTPQPERIRQVYDAFRQQLEQQLLQAVPVEAVGD